ncbi:MAG TPA: hypothetical protein ENN21_03560 [Spirochaetes bacterium]|nr:hypothetical protein [Spirochaetota bacterium]
MESKQYDRRRGVLLGLAAGDRNGGPIRMALQLARSLLAVRGFNEVHILKNYVNWWKADGFDTGPVAGRVFELVAGGVDPGAAASAVHDEMGGMTGGCNPAHRSAPLAMAAFIPEKKLAGCAVSEARLTHAGPIAACVSAATVVLCRKLIMGTDWEAALAAAGRDRSVETRHALLDAPGRTPTAGGYAPEALEAAIYFLDRSGSFGEALGAALDFAGPANYCPVLVGSIGGARWGAAAIPPAALAHCGITAEIDAAASAFNAGK